MNTNDATIHFSHSSVGDHAEPAITQNSTARAVAARAGPLGDIAQWELLPGEVAGLCQPHQMQWHLVAIATHGKTRSPRNALITPSRSRSHRAPTPGSTKTRLSTRAEISRRRMGSSHCPRRTESTSAPRLLTLQRLASPRPAPDAACRRQARCAPRGCEHACAAHSKQTSMSTLRSCRATSYSPFITPKTATTDRVTTNRHPTIEIPPGPPAHPIGLGSS